MSSSLTTAAAAVLLKPPPSLSAPVANEAYLPLSISSPTLLSSVAGRLIALLAEMSPLAHKCALVGHVERWPPTADGDGLSRPDDASSRVENRAPAVDTRRIAANFNGALRRTPHNAFIPRWNEASKLL